MKLISKRNISNLMKDSYQNDNPFEYLTTLSQLSLFTLEQLHAEIPDMSWLSLANTLYNKCKREIPSRFKKTKWEYMISKKYLLDKLEYIVDETNKKDPKIQILFAYDKNYNNLLIKGKNYRNNYERIHGFIILEREFCTKLPRVSEENCRKYKIAQIAGVCSSPHSDRKGLGALLIGAIIVLCKKAKYDYLTLEVSGDQANNYGNERNSSKPLYCYYERLGLREDRNIHDKWGCYNYNFPTMKLDLKKINNECLAKVLTNPKYWLKYPTEYCQDPNILKQFVKISDSCKN
eukprot:TRINITY_DN14112_c0_g1_i1.p1 TRINITY_DN14112_c0_g1~~TRINITY_DN14112_c0_g1_i1.p1  ORF type:complete len:291 (-),score=-54.17 TRINITY_DN14112_c0_g1_i1:20-892(-)